MILLNYEIKNIFVLEVCFFHLTKFHKIIFAYGKYVFLQRPAKVGQQYELHHCRNIFIKSISVLGADITQFLGNKSRCDCRSGLCLALHPKQLWFQNKFLPVFLKVDQIGKPSTKQLLKKNYTYFAKNKIPRNI